LGTEEGFNTAVVEYIAVDAEADFEAVAEFITVGVDTLRQITMMPC